VSIAALTGIVAAIAVGMAALRYASDAWAVSLAIFTLALLFTSILGAIHGTNRGFWRGVALFGWGYLLLDGFTVSWIDSTIRPHTFLMPALTELYPYLHHDPPRQHPGSKGGLGIVLAPGVMPPVELFSSQHRSFQTVGIWISRLLFALLGGIIGRIVIANHRPREDRDVTIRPMPDRS
jgi:hypothetical protein